MRLTKKSEKIAVFVGSLLLLMLFTVQLEAQITVDPGSNKTVCPNSPVTLGGNPTASGGSPPYTYQWTPSTGLSSASAANPTASPDSTTWYTLTVIDSQGNRQTDSVLVTMDPIAGANAGTTQSVCSNNTVQLGGSNNGSISGVTYSWSPAGSLNDATSPNPTATPTATTTYTMVASDAACPNDTSLVTVSILPPPTITAWPDTTILQGYTVTLHASGGTNYSWSPQGSLFNYNTSSPEAEPQSTTTYYVIAQGSNGCYGMDSVIVDVKRDSALIFYNTFTPNNDGVNDFWYIGNIENYPDNILKVYNRYGKLVYSAHGYANQWDGTDLGDKLPAATYYYILYPGNGIKPYKGSVTILR